MVPDWKLERFLTGDLPAEEMKKIEDLESTDEILAQRIKELRDNNVSVLNRFPFDSLSEKIAENEGGKVRSNFGILRFASAAVLVLAVTLVAFISQRDAAMTGTGDARGSDVTTTDVALLESSSDTRIKGFDARMEVWKKTESGIVELKNLDEAREGDEIQLRYSVPQKCFGLLFSMDGNGVVTLHLGDGAKAIALKPGNMNSLPFAYKLDDAPRFEKFFLVTSVREFVVDKNDIDSLLKRSDLNVVDFTLRKVGK